MGILDTPTLPTPRASHTVVIAGDSITENNTTVTSSPFPTSANRIDGYWSWASMLSNHRLRLLKNAGIAGNTSTMLRARFASDVLAYKPGFVVLLIGTNDVRQSVDPPTFETIVSNMEWMYQQCRARGIHLIQMTIPPCGEAADTTVRKQLRERINSWLRVQARLRPGFTLVDIFGALSAPDTGVPTASYPGGVVDTAQVHPNATGAAIIGNLLAPVINQLVPPVELLPGSNLDTGNLLTNGMHSGTYTDFLGHPNVATSWYYTNGDADALAVSVSKVATSDLQRREWQRFDVSAGSCSFRRTESDASKWATGDHLSATIEFRSVGTWQAATSGGELSLKLSYFNASNAIISQSGDMALNGYILPVAFQPQSGVLRTPPLAVPAGTAKIELWATLKAVGVIDWGRAKIEKIAA